MSTPRTKYFHELSDEEVAGLEALWKGRSYDDFEKEYSQPDWCTYPGALHGPMGCWSLLSKTMRKNISYDWCKSCDCHVNNQLFNQS